MIWWIQLLCLTVVGILLFTSPRAISLLPPFVALPYLDHSFPLLPSTPSLWQSVQFSQYGSFGVSSASPDAFPTFNIAAHPPPITCRGRNSALVKVFSAALNPADSKITLGYLTPLLPAFLKDRTTPGFDFSGEKERATRRDKGRAVVPRNDRHKLLLKAKIAVESQDSHAPSLPHS